MDKRSAIELFGGVPALASALGTSRHAVYQWPDDLPPRIADRVLGAALRHGIAVPDALLRRDDDAA